MQDQDCGIRIAGSGMGDQDCGIGLGEGLRD